MTVIRDIPQTFRNYGPTDSEQTWQCRAGQVLITFEQGDDDDRGILLDKGDHLDIPKGKVVYMRATNGRTAWVSVEIKDDFIDQSETRTYDFASGTRTTVGATSSAEVAIGTLGPTREIMLMASTRCHIRFGATGLAAAAAGAGVLPLAADERFHLKVPVGTTHFRVIRDSADGFLSVIPVL